MVKHTLVIRQQELANYLSVFDYFVGLSFIDLMIWYSYDMKKAYSHTTLILTNLLTVKILIWNMMWWISKMADKSTGKPMKI